MDSMSALKADIQLLFVSYYTYTISFKFSLISVSLPADPPLVALKGSVQMTAQRDTKMATRRSDFISMLSGTVIDALSLVKKPDKFRHNQN